MIRTREQAKSRTALVLYGSETGNAQDVAEEIGTLATRLRFDTTVLDFDSVSLRDIVKPSVFIFAISTTGQGEFPQNARRFWKTLLSSGLKSGVLKKVKFASFGLGDSSYPKFNVAHRMLHGRLVQLGAHAFCDRGEGNEQHPEGHSAALRAWIVALKETLLQTFPLAEDQAPIAEDVFVEPKWKLARNPDCHAQPRGVNGSETSDCPSSEEFPLRNQYTADIIQNHRVTPQDHFQDVRRLGLQLHENYPYKPGAVAIIYPKNFPQDVQDFIDLMDWREIADQPLKLITSDPNAPSSSSHPPSPLRHLNLTPDGHLHLTSSQARIHLTLRWLLENVLDIMSIPRRSFFASLSHFATTTTEDSAYQKDRLLELANPDLIDELWDYTTRPKRTILEVMMDFTTIQIPWSYALSTLPQIKGRQFSIATGGAQTSCDRGFTRLELLVAIANPPSPIIKYRPRHGVCTRYIAALQPHSHLTIGLQPGYLDPQPHDLATPALMIGPGTGIAPLRSLIHQRLAWAPEQEQEQEPEQEIGLKSSKQSLKGDILLFGCRSSTADFFYKDEWASLATNHGLKVLTAFSRDAVHPRKYVQDVLREEGPAIYQLLVERKGKLYLCGSSGNMPKGVREALVDVFVAEGGMVREGAEEMLGVMERDGRYWQETW